MIERIQRTKGDLGDKLTAVYNKRSPEKLPCTKRDSPVFGMQISLTHI